MPGAFTNGLRMARFGLQPAKINGLLSKMNGTGGGPATVSGRFRRASWNHLTGPQQLVGNKPALAGCSRFSPCSFQFCADR
jgi:hypothetical protein